MEYITNIALLAHDNRKKDLIEWVEWNYRSPVITVYESYIERTVDGV